MTLVFAMGCGPEGHDRGITAIDLIGELSHAERRPLGGAFEPREVTIDNVRRPALTVPAASRLTWTLQPLPRRGTFIAGIGVPGAATPASVAFRLGISDGRVYETLAEQIVSTPGSRDAWVSMAVDLSRYAGPQWSIFYRPDERRWELILGTHIVEGAPPAAYWAAPRVDTDREAARRYHADRIRAAMSTLTPDHRVP